MDQNWYKRRNMVGIFNYTASPRVQISQKVFLGGEGYFLTHSVDIIA